MTAAVEAVGLCVEVGGRALVDGVDLSVDRGGWTTVVGPNGAGKTTLLRAVAGLARAAGRLALAGVPVCSMTPRQRARAVALVPQSPELPPAMTVVHYVTLGRTAHLRSLGRERPSDRDAVDGALEHLDLAGLAHRPLATLSGGERQRVAVARALAQEAPVLLLDEPTAALDVGHQQELLDLVDRLRRTLALTVVSTMHDLTMTAQYGDHLLLLRSGRVVAAGPPGEVLTSAHLREHYGARVDVIRHHGSLVVVPWRPPPDEEEP